MKPCVLASLKCRLDCPKEFLQREYELGEVYAYEADPSKYHISKLLEVAKQRGYVKKAKQPFYLDPSITVTNGSIGWHNDPGIGKVATLLLYESKLYDEPAALITKHGVLYVKPGDIFVFDANQFHAWLSNSLCIFAQACVKKNKTAKE